jgi:hypothetical protein
VFEDCFAGVKRLGATGHLGQSVKAVLSFGIKSNGEHALKLPLLYVYSKRGNLGVPVSGGETRFSPRWVGKLPENDGLPDLIHVVKEGVTTVF